MPNRPAASWAGAALALAFATGCDEPPSYTVRWTLVDEAQLDHPDPPPLNSVKQCAEVGVSKVRVTTKQADDTVVDQREYSCFPGAFERGDPVAVPTLPAGEYTVTIEGLRRTGEPWDCAAESETCVALAESSVTIVEDSDDLPTVEVVLLQPPQCDDGIDNDLDGRVDGKDPACILNVTDVEGADFGVALFQTSVTFLGSSAVYPPDVSVDGFRLEVDGELLREVWAAELDLTQWPFRLPLIGEPYDPGSYVFSIIGIDADGNPRTMPQTDSLVVTEDQAGFVVGQFDFTGDLFLEPIVEEISVITNLLLDPTGQQIGICTVGGFPEVTIASMWFRVTDENDQPLDAAALGFTDFMPTDQPGGWVSLACPTAPVTSMPLLWGSYKLEIEARIGDAVCFTSEGIQDLAPLGQSGAQNFYLARVVDANGAPPPGCEECVSDSNCSGQICENGLCKDKF
jgi:hypothetical protein